MAVWVLAFTAVTSIGAIAVAMNAHWQADEMGYALSDSGARVLLADQERLSRLTSAPPGLQVLAVRPALPLAPGVRLLATLTDAAPAVNAEPAPAAVAAVAPAAISFGGLPISEAAPAAEPSDAGKLTAAEVSEMKVAELKEALEARSLPTTGRKAELAARLMKALSN